MNRHRKNANVIDSLINPEKLTLPEGYRYWYRQYRQWNGFICEATDLPGYWQAEKAYHDRIKVTESRSPKLETLVLRATLKYYLKPELIANWLVSLSYKIVGKKQDGCNCPIARYLREIFSALEDITVFVSFEHIEVSSKGFRLFSVPVEGWLENFITTIDDIDHNFITKEEAIAALKSALEVKKPNLGARFGYTEGSDYELQFSDYYGDISHPHEGSYGEMRDQAAQRLKKARKEGHAITTLAIGWKWEIEDDGRGMVDPRCGVMEIYCIHVPDADEDVSEHLMHLHDDMALEQLAESY